MKENKAHKKSTRRGSKYEDMSLSQLLADAPARKIEMEAMRKVAEGQSEQESAQRKYPESRFDPKSIEMFYRVGGLKGIKKMIEFAKDKNNKTQDIKDKFSVSDYTADRARNKPEFLLVRYKKVEAYLAKEKKLKKNKRK